MPTVSEVRAFSVSTALDTNGQKYRYMQAAERWGTDPDVLKAFIVGRYDPADVGGRFREAAKKIGGLSIRSAHAAEAYFDFPRDIRWTRSTHSEVKRLADECHVIHLNNSFQPYLKLKMVRKPALLHHHGTLFRNHPTEQLRVAKLFHMVQAVSTVDLKLVAPNEELHWLPTAYDLEMLAGIREDNRRPDDGKVRIVSCPTNREVKSTAALEAAVAQLQAEGLPVELVVVTQRPWREALAIKATADIYFDQVKLGYGCNAVEAWGMGLPVVAGATPEILAAMRKEWGTRTLPFHQATEDTIADSLRQLVNNPELRAKVAARGTKHAEKYHAEKPALARLAELYGMAIRKATEATDWSTGGLKDGPGVFVTELPRLVVPIHNHRIAFVDSKAVINDPQMAGRLRRLARMRPQWKITEVDAA